jgi:photosystem II stability/assembly factor-like uncharacterized protein
MTLGFAMIRKVIALYVPLLLLAAVKPGLAPRFDRWKIIGPGGGGTMIAPTISPHDPNLVVEHCDMTGAYITLDGGQSWRMFNLRSGVSTFAFDPGDPKVIYAGNEALWRSRDNGRSWSMVFPDPKKNTVEHQNGDHSSARLTSDDASYPGRGIGTIAVDPADSKRIYLASSGGRGGGPSPLLVSADGGASWSPAGEFPSERILTMQFEPGALLVIGNQRMHRLASGTWEHFAGPEGGIRAASAGRANGVTTIYATTPSGVSVSGDGGRTWRAASPQLGQTAGRFEAIATSAGNALTAYVGFRGLQLGEGRANQFNGIAKTTDGGRTWAIVHKESDGPSANLEASWIEGRVRGGGRDIWFDAPYSLGVAPTRPDVCYATDLFRTYRTLDGGRSWQQVNSVRVGENRWTTRGLDVTTNYGVHFDPFNPKHIFIGYTDIGAFQSYDGGASWVTATEGIPPRWRNTTYWLEFDPKAKGLMWGAFSGTHDLPRPKMWRGRDPERYTGGVGISTDGGATWQPSNNGMPETAVTHLLLDPASRVGSRTLYACGYGRGVYKSTDNGKSWALKSEGITERKPFAWRMTRAGDGTLYLVVARSNEGRPSDIGDGALYRSADGAEHWARMRLPDGVNGPVGLTLDPRDDRGMYLAAWGQEHTDVDTGGGIYFSADAGATWRNIFRESQHVYDVTVDPKNPKVLYACGFDAAAWRSVDGGATWKKLQGYNFKWGHRVVLDPHDPASVYITTYGGSVWHGPAAGDPKALGDVLNPVPVAR